MSLPNLSACFSKRFSKILPAGLALGMMACSSAPQAPETAPVDAQVTEKSEAAQAQEQITRLQDKIQDLETRLSALNEKNKLEK